MWKDGPRVKNRQLITPSIPKGLKNQMGLFCSDFYKTALFAAALANFFGALSISELVASSKSSTSDQDLLLSDVQLCQG